MDKLREKEASPTILMALGGVVLVAILVAVFLLVIKPNQEAAQTLRDFNSPEAQAKRDPDQRKVDPNFASAVSALKAKEKHMNVTGGAIGRRRE